MPYPSWFEITSYFAQHLQVFIFLIWDALLLLIVYGITVYFGSSYWRERWYIWVAVVGAAAVAVEAGWSVWQLRRERREREQIATNADVTAGLLESIGEAQEEV